MLKREPYFPFDSYINFDHSKTGKQKHKTKQEKPNKQRKI